jgi:hypothetical protein
MKASHILSFTLFTLNIVWGKPKGGGAQPSELPFVHCARYTKVFSSLPNLWPLLDELDVCALSKEPFPTMIE